MNFLNKKAAYLETGNWAKKAIKEAKLFGEVQIVATSADKNFTYLPKNFIIPTDVDYFHITTNNTIYGTELKTDLNSPVPLVADMSSDICSRPIDISKYSLIYAGAQKNIGPAGVTIAIIKDEFLNHQVTDRIIPTMLNYKTHTENNSL
jgi:phosphoserine aminotransferase